QPPSTALRRSSALNQLNTALEHPCSAEKPAQMKTASGNGLASSGKSGATTMPLLASAGLPSAVRTSHINRRRPSRQLAKRSASDARTYAPIMKPETSRNDTRVGVL